MTTLPLRLIGALVAVLLFGVTALGEACESKRRAELERCVREHPGLPQAVCIDASNRWMTGGMRTLP